MGVSCKDGEKVWTVEWKVDLVKSFDTVSLPAKEVTATVQVIIHGLFPQY